MSDERTHEDMEYEYQMAMYGETDDDLLDDMDEFDFDDDDFEDE